MIALHFRFKIDEWGMFRDHRPLSSQARSWKVMPEATPTRSSQNSGQHRFRRIYRNLIAFRPEDPSTAPCTENSNEKSAQTADC